MKTNAGEFDRILRIISGIIMVSYGMTYLAIIIPLGLFLIATGIIGWCPLYTLFRIETTSIEEQIQN